MGKVKLRGSEADGRRRQVSIPYGKGKVSKAYTLNTDRCDVSIPYGKGKEQHLVLCFYYNT